MQEKEKNLEEKPESHPHGFFKREPESDEEHFEKVRLASAMRMRKRLNGRVRTLARDLD